MRVTDYRNTDEQQVFQGKFNPWIGISLGNKYFTAEHLEDYIQSCLRIAHEKVLVIIADEPHAINYEVFEEMKHETALAKALRNGDKVKSVLDGIVSRMTRDEKEKVKIVRWQELSDAFWYQERLKIFQEFFRDDKNFKDALVEIVRLNMGDRIEDMESSKIERLATYVLEELPIFIGAIELEDSVYDLHLYPGLSLMDDFILDLQEKKIFPGIMDKINVRHPLSLIEAYAE
jgi:tRNA-dependent cyclodipeptide synthase